jgi:Glycosyl transferase 4-like domain
MGAAVAIDPLVLHRLFAGRWPATEDLSSAATQPVAAADPLSSRRRPVMTRLLLISQTFPPDNAASAVRAGQIFKYLPEHGYQPVVVAANPDERSIGGDLLRRVPSEKRVAAVSLVSTFARWFTRFLSPYDDRLSWAPHAVDAAVRIMKSQPVQAVYSTSPFLSAHFAALWLKARFGLPWIADFQDPVRDNPFRSRRWIYPYDALIERLIFRHAERLAANTDAVAATWRERYPQWAEKVSVLWNSFDPSERIEPGVVPPRSYRVLAHIGSLYDGRHPAKLLASLERLDIAPSDVRIKLVGPIAPDVLAAHAPLFARLSAKGALEFGNAPVPREEALRETAEADYLVLLDVYNDRDVSLQLPSKLMDYVRFGKPILAYTPKGSPAERILARSGVPNVTIDPLASEEVADRKLLELLSLSAEPQRPSAWFQETFSARTLARTVAGLLDEMLRESSARDASGAAIPERAMRRC